MLAVLLWWSKASFPDDCDLTKTNRDNETALDMAVRRGDVALIFKLELAARRRGLMNSTWKQKLKENQVK